MAKMSGKHIVRHEAVGDADVSLGPLYHMMQKNSDVAGGESVSKYFLSTIPESAQRQIIDAYRTAPGNELSRFGSPESSAQLVANTFGFFIDRPGDLPLPPEWCGEIARKVFIEKEVRFPWPGGTHSWLDVVIETASSLIGVEAKRFEPFRGKPGVCFSDAYWRDVWGANVRGYERMRDALSSGKIKFDHLKADQLVKHAFGLRTQARKLRRKPVLIYLYAQPNAWSDGTVIADEAHVAHCEEAKRFAREVADDEVRFVVSAYRDLLAHWQTDDCAVHKHAQKVLERYRL